MKYFLTSIVLLLFFSSFAQLKLDGVIYHAETGLPIAGVEVEVHETRQKTYTSVKGQFNLVLSPGSYHLHFQSLGFEAEDLDIELLGDTSIERILKPTFLELKEVLVEESNLKTIDKNTSLDVEHINFEEGEKSIESSLAEALKKNPGLEAYNTGVGIAKPIIRGFTATRISVYDNGVKQEGQQWGMDHGLEIDPFNTSRVEIIKGAGALQYGSDAIGGVVKLLPDVVPEEGTHGSYTSLYKSNNNTYGNSLKISYRKGDHFIIARASYQFYDDFRIPAEEFIYNGFVLPVVDNTLKNTAGKLLSYRLSYGLHKNRYNLRVNASRYQQKVGLYSGAIGIPRAFDVADIGSVSDIEAPNQDVIHTKLNAALNLRLGDNWLNTNIGYQFNDREEHSRPDSHGLIRIEEGNTLALDLDLHTLSHNSRYSWSASSLKYTIGLDQQYQKNNNGGWEFLLPEFSFYTAGIFALAEGKSQDGKWNWNGGVRLNYAQLESQEHFQPYFNDLDSLIQRAPNLSRQFLNYAASAGLAFNPNDDWNFKINLAKSFRVPVPAELVSNGVHHGTFRHEMGNPNLNAEEGIQLDLGSTYQQKNLYLKFTPFLNYFTNYIYLRPTGRFSDLPDAGQLYIYSETEALYSGFELFAEYHPIESIHLSSGLEYVNNLNLETRLPLPFTPPLSNLFTVEYEEDKEKLGWKLALEYRITAAQKRTDRNEPETPAYQLFNVRSSFNFSWNTYKCSLGASLLNVFDTAYLSHLSRYRILNLPEQGRNLVLNLNIQF